MSKKKIILIAIFAIVLLFFSVFSGIIINQMIENDKKWEKIEENQRNTWCTDTSDIACIANNAKIRNEESEICKKVLADHTSYFREDVDRCKSILGR